MSVGSLCRQRTEASVPLRLSGEEAGKRVPPCLPPAVVSCSSDSGYSVEVCGEMAAPMLIGEVNISGSRQTPLDDYKHYSTSLNPMQDLHPCPTCTAYRPCPLSEIKR